ncbi:MAG: molybdopterin-dependent oxidoreductase [Desulfobulbaceae bacterium]|nr:molybdopterin-dependent oxidoreductase [Desulfobulbaceae bacterium]
MKKAADSGNDKKISRRALVKGGAAAAVTMAWPAKLALAGQDAAAQPEGQKGGSRLDPDARVVHSVCLGCNAHCGNRIAVKNGTLAEISGNPYHPYNSMAEPAAYQTPVAETLALPSPVCGKAQDAANYLTNPYRLIRPLKRTGPRGSGSFAPIDWEQLIREVALGGKIFAELGEERTVPGLAELNSDAPIDPRDPGLGPKRNGLVFMTGRLQNGRQEFIDRFVKDGFGSTNRIGHTDICGLGFRMGNLALTEGKEVELKADPWGAEYILVFGANIYEALQPGINTYGAAVARRSAAGKLTFAIVDPRAQNASVHAHDWIPIIPGQDGAFAMGMIRWLIEHRRYNHRYLSAPNLEAARAAGFATYNNATHLVIDDPAHPNHGRFLRLADLSLAEDEKAIATYIVLSEKEGSPVAFDRLDRAVLDRAATLRDAKGRAIRVKTAFRLLREGVMAHTIEQYAAFAGVPAEQIAGTAAEFSAHGTRAAVCQYHGAGNYASGTYAAFAVAALNAMVGSVEMKGGYLSGGGGIGTWKKGPYNLTDFPGKRKPAGVKISREKGVYEKSSEYREKKAATGSGYPSRRPWFRFTKGGLSVETLSGIDERYPYPCGALFTYFYNPVYSTPGGNRYIETLRDPARVPLHVSIDTSVNESNLYADYIVPDVTYLEGHYGWLNPHAPALRFTGLRTPAMEPLTCRTADGRPFCLETFLIDLAEKLELPGFGEGAITDRDGGRHALHRAEDFYLRGYANIAAEAQVPVATATELAFVERNYPVSRFKEILNPEQWRQTCHALARGGIFSDYQSVFEGERFLHGIKRTVLYNEELATSRNTLTGERFPGTLCYLPPMDASGAVLAEKDRAYPFTVVTHKMNVHTQSRTSCHRWAMEIFPENFVVVNEGDAARMGLRDGDRVRLRSASNPEGVEGKAKVSRLIRPGCVAISFHYGHSQLGASPLAVKDAEQVFLGGAAVAKAGGMKGDPRLGRGLNPNLLSRLDERLANTPLVDMVGGIPDFSSTRVQLVKL